MKKGDKVICHTTCFSNFIEIPSGSILTIINIEDRNIYFNVNNTDGWVCVEWFDKYFTHIKTERKKKLNKLGKEKL